MSFMGASTTGGGRAPDWSRIASRTMFCSRDWTRCERCNFIPAAQPGWPHPQQTRALMRP